MKHKPSLLTEVVVAAGLTVAVAVIGMALSIFAPGAFGVKIAIGFAAGAYGLRMFSCAKSRGGRFVALVFAAGAVAAGILFLGVGELAALVAAMFWLQRSIAYYRGLVPVALDGLLTCFSLLAAAGAAVYAQSLIAGIWCFLLLQALHSLIPVSFGRSSGSERGGAAGKDAFDAAHRAAEEALRALFAQ